MSGEQQSRSAVWARANCAGCAEGLTFPHQHATLCPVFSHADAKQLADFIKCGCGHLYVSYVDLEQHLQEIARRVRFGLELTP